MQASGVKRLLVQTVSDVKLSGEKLFGVYYISSFLASKLFGSNCLRCRRPAQRVFL